MTRRAPSRAELQQLLEEQPDIKQGEIAERFGISRPFVSKLLRAYGLKSPRTTPRYDDVIPWGIRREDDNLYWTRILRAAGRIRAEMPGGRQDAVKALRTRVSEMAAAGAALTYDPDSDPMADPNGWWPFWVVESDPTDRVLEIPGIGELRLSLAHIPDERLSTHERLLKLAASNGGK
jgi:hypothetical protein